MEPIYVVVRTIILAVLTVFFRWKIIGLEKIPRSGPAIVASNHISNFDPLCVAYLVDRAGRRPRFLAKASLWKNPLMRFALNGCRQIPVERGSGDLSPMRAAEAAIARDQVVVIYPEGTITNNPDLTPMRGKTGVARLALATGVPVYPVAVWGAQWVLPKERKGRFRFRQLIMLTVGEPLRFDDLRDRANEPAVVRDVTDRVMSEVDRLVRELHKAHPQGAAIPDLKGGRGE